MRTTRHAKSSIQGLCAAKLAGILSGPAGIGGSAMGTVAASLAMMGTGQVLLASVLLGSYALALGQLAGTRGRQVAIAAAILAAAAFVVLSEPWEAGVILVAFAPVGMGLFCGVAWTLSKMTSGSTRSAVLAAAVPLQLAPRQAAAGSLLGRMRARLRFI